MPGMARAGKQRYADVRIRGPGNGGGAEPARADERL